MSRGERRSRRRENKKTKRFDSSFPRPSSTHRHDFAGGALGLERKAFGDEPAQGEGQGKEGRDCARERHREEANLIFFELANDLNLF